VPGLISVPVGVTDELEAVRIDGGVDQISQPGLHHDGGPARINRRRGTG